MPILRLVVLLGLLGLQGCSTPNIKSDYQLEKSTGEGVVIGSVTYDGRLSEFKVFYRAIPDGKAAFFKAGVGQVPPFPRNDFSGAGATGELFSSALPAGVYEFFAWGIHSGGAGTASTEPFSIKFTVTAGQPTYLGNFHFVPNRMLGLTVTGAVVYHRSEAERDLQVFKRNYPSLAAKQIKMPSIAGNGSPISGSYETKLYMAPLTY